MMTDGMTVNSAVHANFQEICKKVNFQHTYKSVDKLYCCDFCGGIHQQCILDRRSDVRCLSTPAFQRSIEQFLFKYDIAPNQTWRDLYIQKTPGYRLAMAERFMCIITPGAKESEWTDTLRRRSWDTRGSFYTSNAGSCRAMYESGRFSEFVPPTASTPRASSSSSSPIVMPDSSFLTSN